MATLGNSCDRGILHVQVGCKRLGPHSWFFGHIISYREINAKVQMQRWNGEVWSVNETCAKLGEKCLQLLSLHYLTGSDTTSFLFGKGKIRALKILKNGLLPNLDTVLGEADIAQEELKTIGESFFCIMYGYPSGTKIGDVRYQMHTKEKQSSRLTSTATNRTEHVPPHSACPLPDSAREVSCKKGPPDIDISEYGWKLKDGIPMPVKSDLPPAPKNLLDVICCSCKAERKVCSSRRCSCCRNQISCTVYCKCESNKQCLNDYGQQAGLDDRDEEENLSD